MQDTEIMAADVGRPGDHEGDRSGGPLLFIFVNRRRFTAEQGVTPAMTGGAIAALVGVAGDQAVIRRGQGPNGEPVAVDATVELQQAEHFVVTRRIVEGG